jgi:hypothetical protein
MRSLVIVLVALVLPGFVPALWLTRYPLPALVLAPMVTGLACALGGVLALLTRTPLLPWVVVTLAAVNVVVAARLWVRLKADPDPPVADSGGLAFRSVVPLALVVAPLLTVRQAPHAWDARSIWWFHAKWFWAGGESVARALSNPAFVFSHPEYPPLAPATIGALWHLRSPGDFEFAQLVSAVLTVAPVLFLAMAIGGRFTVTTGRRVGAVVSAIALLGVYGETMTFGTNGYVDLQWAAAFCAAAVLLLLWPAEPRFAALGAAPLAYAAMTKSEGTLSAILLLVIVALRLRGQWRLLALPAMAAASGLTWMIVARLHGAESDLAGGSTASSWMRGEFVGFDRLRPTLTAVWSVGRGTVLAAVVMVALGSLFLRHERRRRGIPGAGYLLLVAAAVQSLMVLVYVVSPHDLGWHLATSLTRTILVVQLLLVVEMVVWIGVAIATATDAVRNRASADAPTLGDPSDDEEEEGRLSAYA